MRPPDNEPDSRMDSWLDSRMDAALKGYAEPGGEIAPRLIAARVIAAEGERQRVWRRWALAGLAPLLACLLVVVPVLVRQHDVGRNRKAHAALPARTAAAAPLRRPFAAMNVLREPSGRPPSFAHAKMRARPRAEPIGPPRLDQFPTPQPLTEEEQVMLAFVSTASPATQQMVARAVAPPLLPDAAAPKLRQDSPLPDTQKTGVNHEEPR